LAKEKRVSANGLNRAYERSIHPDLQDKILYYLLDEKTPCIKGEAFAIKHIREGAEHILEGFDHQCKKTRHSDSSMSPSSATPVKSEQTPPVYALYAQGHASNLCPDKLKFKPHVGCAPIM